MRDAGTLPYSMHQAPTTPSRIVSQNPPDSTTSSAVVNTSHSAALRGATLAFQAQKKGSERPNADSSTPKPAPRTPNPTVRDHGALLAATQASRDHPGSRSRSPVSGTKGRAGVSRQTTGGSAQETGPYSQDLESSAVAHRLTQFLGSSPMASSPHLLTPSGVKPSPDHKSASFIAATLAASRTGSPAPPTQTFAQAPLSHTQLHARISRRKSSVSNSAHSSASVEDRPDSTSIAPTGSLISMFETQRQDTDPVKKGDAVASASGRDELASPPRMRAITPPREMSPRRTTTIPNLNPQEEGYLGQLQVETKKPKPKPKPKPKSQAQPNEILWEDATDSARSGMTVLPRLKDIKPKAGVLVSTAEKPKPKPKPSLNEASAAERRVIAPDPETVDWPLPSPRAVTSNTKGPPVIQRSSTRPAAATAATTTMTTTGPTEGGKPGPQPVQPVSPKSKPQVQPKPTVQPRKRPITPPQLARHVTTEVHSPRPTRIVPNLMLEQPTLPPRSSSIKTSTGAPSSSQSQVASTVERGRAWPSLDEGQQSVPRPASQNSTSSDDTFVSASSTQSPRARSPARNPEQALLEPAVPEPLRKQTPLKVPTLQRSPSMEFTSRSSPGNIFRSSTISLSPNSSSNLALDSLTSAMMASNLAASRSAANTPSRSSPAPPPPPRRQSQRHHSPLHPSNTGGSPNRAGKGGAKPQGRMLQTLRAPASLSDDEDTRRRLQQHRKKPLGRKKHAHHEGSRRRWRDEVTTKERRRYEAVWASNRGLFLDASQLDMFAAYHNVPVPVAQKLDPGDLVANVVVRDIWGRSRLPTDELAEVWELVDHGQIGALSKHEFVVGMWLIDQRLRGRKIPSRVGDSVWDSARDMKFVEPGKNGKKR